MYFWFFLRFSHMSLNVFLFNFCFHALWSVYVSKVKLTIQTNQNFFLSKVKSSFPHELWWLFSNNNNKWMNEEKKIKFKQIYIFLSPIWPWINDSHVYFLLFFWLFCFQYWEPSRKLTWKLNKIVWNVSVAFSFASIACELLSS